MIVIASVSVAALGNGNDIVDVIDAVDDHGSISFVSIVFPRSCTPKLIGQSYAPFGSRSRT